MKMSRRKCSVIGCKNSKLRNPKKLFHRYPLQMEKLKIWIRWSNPQLFKKLDKPLSITEFIICEDHFEKNQYQHQNSKRLNRNAIPTLNLPFGPPPFSTFTMNRYGCSVIGCENNVSKNPNMKFHCYPKNVKKAMTWINLTNRDLLQHVKLKYLKFRLICEEHFERKHYQNVYSKKLNSNAIPTLKLPYQIDNLDEITNTNTTSTIPTDNVKNTSIESVDLTKIKPEEKWKSFEKILRATQQKSVISEDDITSCYINISDQIKPEEITLEDPLQSNPNPEIVKDEIEVTKPLVLSEISEGVKIEETQESLFSSECMDPVDLNINKISTHTFNTKSKDKNKICRICFTSGINLIDIFQVDVDKVNFYMKFRICFVDLEMEDTLSQNTICEQCCLNIRQTYNFKILCQEGNTKIISMSKAKQLKEYCENENTFEEPMATVELLSLTDDVVEMTEPDALQIEELPIDEIIEAEIINTMQLEKNILNVNNFMNVHNIVDPNVVSNSKGTQVEMSLKNISDDDEKINDEDNQIGVESNESENVAITDRTDSTMSNPSLRYMKCSFCQDQFFSMEVLQRHMKTHLTKNAKTSVKLYKCSYCTSKFLNIMSLAKHRQVVHKTVKQVSHPRQTREKNLLKCSQCPKICEMPSQLRKHEEMHARRLRRLARRKELFLCEVCGKTFKYKKTYELHTARHSDLKPYICETCGKAFRFEANLKSHVSLHTDIKPFVCEACGKSFRLKGTLRTHLRFHTGEKPYSCQICEKKFRISSSYKSHLRRHTGERPYKCPFEGCNEEYTDLTHLNRHKLKMHIRKKEHICIECGASFYYRFALKRHELLHGDQVKPFVCDTCGKSFLHASSLRKHKKTHEVARPYCCETCGKTFKQPTYLKYHYDKVHNKKTERDTPEVKPECLVCNRTFQSEHTLKLHMKIHQMPKERPAKVDDEGERTFACTFCDKKFKNDSHLKIHVRLHTQERPYRCETCGKTFSQSVGLRLHIFTHTGEKKYSCEMCNKKYRQPGHLQAHRNWHYGIKPHECRFCFRQYSQKRDLRLHMEKMHGYHLKHTNVQIIQTNDELSQSSNLIIPIASNEIVYVSPDVINEDDDENKCLNLTLNE